MKATWLILLVSCLISGTFASAAPSSEEIPYYGEKFYRDLATGVANDDLKENIKTVLTSMHMRVDGGMDEIGNCSGGRNCYQHVALGYDGARVFLLGNFYLVNAGNGTYDIKDVYCDTIRTSAEFGGSKRPGPNVIPEANILNTEHTWPQSRFNGRMNKGMQKSDMHHLYPTDNEMNSIRGNNPFGEVAKDKKTLRCKASRYGKSTRGNADVFEPPANHRGNVARSLFYFSIRYDLQIDSNQEAYLRKWSKEDPVDEEEIRRNDEIHRMQGNRNPFIDFPGLEDSINNF